MLLCACSGTKEKEEKEETATEVAEKPVEVKVKRLEYEDFSYELISNGTIVAKQKASAQFENFKQPLIILFEIPIDISFALGLLLVCGHSLNLMSAIGLVVTSGIIINDSILKVDVMNQLRKEGFSLMDAIHEAGRRRLKAILMTSLTSIVCMVPLLFTGDLGSQLEKPLAIATIGGMIMGTPVSLFVVPVVYWWIYRKEELRIKSER
jgi:multidrug efflux pump subunit AcrB